MNAQEKIKGHFNSNRQVFDTDNQSYWIDYFEKDIALISKDGYYGFIGKDGSILCPPKYDKIFPFNQNTAIVCLDDQYGLINQKGKEVISPSIFFIDNLFNGLAWFQKEKNGPWSLLNIQGEIIATDKYQLVTRFREGFALVIDYEDNVLVISKQDQIIYQERQSVLKEHWNQLFSDNLWVSTRNTNNQRLNKNNSLTSSGLTKTPFQFSNGLALIAKKVEKEVKYGYINEKGTLVIKPNFEDARNFDNGFAPVKKDGQWGGINPNNKVIIKPAYQSIEIVDDNLFIVSQNNRFGVINKKNKVLLTLAYTSIKYLFDCLFAILKEEISTLPSFSTETSHQETGKWGVIDVKKDNVVIPIVYDHIYAVNQTFGLAINYQIEEFSSTKLDTLSSSFVIGQATSMPPFKQYKVVQNIQIFNKKGFKNSSTYILTPSFIAKHLLSQEDVFGLSALTTVARSYYISDETNPIFVDQRGTELKRENEIESLRQRMHRKDLKKQQSDTGLFGMVDDQNKILIPFEFNQIKIGHSGVILRKADKYGFTDLKGKRILDLIYDGIEETDTAVLKVSKNNEVFLIDKKGHKI